MKQDMLNGFGQVVLVEFRRIDLEHELPIRSEITFSNRSALQGIRRYIVLVEMPARCATLPIVCRR